MLPSQYFALSRTIVFLKLRGFEQNQSSGRFSCWPDGAAVPTLSPTTVWFECFSEYVILMFLGLLKRQGAPIYASRFPLPKCAGISISAYISGCLTLGVKWNNSSSSRRTDAFMLSNSVANVAELHPCLRRPSALLHWGDCVCPGWVGSETGRLFSVSTRPR